MRERGREGENSNLCVIVHVIICYCKIVVPCLG